MMVLRKIIMNGPRASDVFADAFTQAADSSLSDGEIEEVPDGGGLHWNSRVCDGSMMCAWALVTMMMMMRTIF